MSEDIALPPEPLPFVAVLNGQQLHATGFLSVGTGGDSRATLRWDFATARTDERLLRQLVAFQENHDGFDLDVGVAGPIVYRFNAHVDRLDFSPDSVIALFTLRATSVTA